ncbi:hypothetical protein ACN27E_25255 [Mycobacterium sp. WMMD1722]|uniref:hypothetical protein n=1 Tax=Mycobacterium sp. WMMD1722 TaxID=3404117 RepID=UPI003BF5CE40
MSSEQIWGAPAPSTWSARETAAAVAVAVLIGVLGGGVIYAATDHGATGPGPGRWGPPPGMADAPGPGGAPTVGPGVF